MGLALLMMMLIVVIALVVVGAVMYYGSQHDTHTDIRHAESSHAVQVLREQEEKRSKRLNELQSKTEA